MQQTSADDIFRCLFSWHFKVFKLKLHASEFLSVFPRDVCICCIFVSPSSKEGQIGEMMKNSGDSSQQLSMLNEQLSQKNRLVNAFTAFGEG